MNFDLNKTTTGSTRCHHQQGIPKIEASKVSKEYINLIICVSCLLSINPDVNIFSSVNTQ